jgi:carboxypeptidase family protein/TonB-dependent receptor-like protein
MWVGPIVRAVVSALCVFLSIFSSGQTQTAGRIAGTVRDAQGAVIASAEVALENLATADKRTTTSDSTGNYSVTLLPPAKYDLKIQAKGFTSAIFHNMWVGLAETTTVNATLQVSPSSVEVTVTDAPPLLRSDSSELSTTLDSRSLTQLPLPTRNFLQLLTLVPGVTAPLVNNNAIGRNSPNVSVNGSRVTQNSYRINGVDANDISMHVFADVGVPAPESVSEVNVQTSLYDASMAGAGGSVQVVTKSGSNFLHGGVYEYFRNEALNANDANLKAVGDGRPEMRRNVYGATLGGRFARTRLFCLPLTKVHGKRTAQPIKAYTRAS